MDDVDEGAGYSANIHYRQNSTPRSKLPIHPQFVRRFTEQDDEESNSDDIKNTDQRPPPPHHHQLQQPPIDFMEEDGDGEADADDDEEDDSSMESHGKRRKLDNFEFVPRKPTSLSITGIPHSKPPAAKNSPPDWSEDSTFILLEGWGERYVKNGRKPLRSDEWSDVALKVNQRSRTTRSDSQCRNRLDTLKKKYRKEKLRMAEDANFKSDWVYFEKMDSLMGLPLPLEQALVPAKKRSPVRLACGVDAGEYVFANSNVYLNRANAMDEMRDSPGDTGTDNDDGNEEDDESDGLPPTVSEKKKKNEKGRGGSHTISPSSLKMLADSIQKFGEIYERTESSKRQQMAELERMRKDFCKDMEAQKRRILERAQAEIARIRQEEGEEEEESMTGDGDGDNDEDDGINGSAGNLSG